MGKPESIEKEVGPMQIEVVPLMWHWADWRRNGCYGRAWPRLSMTGKIMAGMQSTMCPSCRGEGRMPGWRIQSALAWIDPCPRCSGWGRISGELSAQRRRRTIPCFDCGGYYQDRQIVLGRGEFNGATCIKCTGAGVRTLVFEQVNPAGIKATRFAGANEDDDPVSMMIDRTVASWSQFDATWWMHAIVITEYASTGTQQMKAAKRGISEPFYSRNLMMAHGRIKEKLALMLEVAQVG